MMNRIVILFLFCSIILGSVAQNKIDPNGYNQFFYENGQLSSEGYMHDGQPDGYWKTYYENGIIKSEGNRKDFKLDSIWTFYGDSGHVALQITYLDDRKNGIRRTYHENEVIEENFINDIKQGFTFYYFPNGELWKKINFVDGLEEGTAKEFASSDSRVIKLTYYKKGYITDIERINSIDKAGMKQGRWKYF